MPTIAYKTVADYLSRQNSAAGKEPLTIKDVLTAMIKAHEIQGCLALENSFNRVGLDHVLLVRVASTAVVTHMIDLFAVLIRQTELYVRMVCFASVLPWYF